MTYKDAPKLVQHPVRRRIETLQVLLRPANHLRKSLSGSTTGKAQASPLFGGLQQDLAAS